MPVIEQILAELQRLNETLERLAPKAAPEVDFTEVAFRWSREASGAALIPVPRHRPGNLDDLRGIDLQKDILDRNTRQFLKGFPCNNALLWGSRGTGKSSLIRALLDTYRDQGLRMIEVDRAHLQDIPVICHKIAGRSERFIIFLDDLAFEENNGSFKTLKAAVEGSLAETPENVLIYATSNRRHLMPEFHSENRAARMVDGELHHGETVEEKISLSERFGVWLSFHPFSQDQYLEIVEHWIHRLGGKDPICKVREEALSHALMRGSRSGRVAHQFAKDWTGRKRLTE